MKSLSLLVAFLTAMPCLAQSSEAPYPIRSGERVRILLVPDARLSNSSSVPYVGTVQSADADSLTLALSGTPLSARGRLAWRDIEQVERATPNHTGEALGLVAGGVGGALAGYAVADILSPSPFAGVGGGILGGLGGLLVGGVIGSKIGNGWEIVPPTRAASALRVLIPLR